MTTANRLAAPVALVTGASSGFGRMIASELAGGRSSPPTHRCATTGGGGAQAGRRDCRATPKEHGVDLRTVELDVQSDSLGRKRPSTRCFAAHGRLDVLVHNAGHMVYGPSEAFTPEQLAEIYDINVLGTQRVNRAALPAHAQGAERASSSGSPAAA